MQYLEKIEKFGTQRWRPKLLRQKATPYGRCIFYNDQERCTVHGVKPLECRISTCSTYGPQLTEWFMLNYYVDPKNPNSIREWAAKLHAHPTIPGGEIHEMVKDKEFLKKVWSYEVLR
jgi:Fe-S-cluster containining protein